ncbi:MAG: GNAT family N-acetyltransferase [Bacteroidales bacterium]|nr:GNAT family N-acetyltransferase [Bacteroidales bacterium]
MINKIADRAPVEEIIAELTPERLLRKTNNGNNEVYVFTGPESPVLMREIGRVREHTFRAAGGGTGLGTDIDSYDTNAEHPHRQLIVWDPDNLEIIGGYRYFINDPSNPTHDIARLASHPYFNFSPRFINDFLPYLMELGRSFVQPEYQSKAMGRKSLFSLDNLWDGLGAIVIETPNVRYMFGKVTMYRHYNQRARDMILYFMRKHFGDREQLVTPKEPVYIDIHEDEMKKLFVSGYRDDYKTLSSEVRKLGENIPPLFNAYMNLSPTMRTFGTFINHHFGNVEETGIMITVRDIYVEKIDRHLASYRDDFEFDKID